MSDHCVSICNEMREVTHMPPLTMNQAKDLARDGKQRPIERGQAEHIMKRARDEMDKIADEEEDVFTKIEKEKAEKKSKVHAQKASQKAETELLKQQAKHTMKLRNKNKNTIVQPGKFARDLRRHF